MYWMVYSRSRETRYEVSVCLLLYYTTHVTVIDLLSQYRRALGTEDVGVDKSSSVSFFKKNIFFFEISRKFIKKFDESQH